MSPFEMLVCEIVADAKGAKIHSIEEGIAVDSAGELIRTADVKCIKKNQSIEFINIEIGVVNWDK